MRIGIISDLHSTFDEPLKEFLAEVDEIWCAGDIGSQECAQAMSSLGKPVVAVHGNIDDYTMRLTYPAWQCFERAGATILMTHIPHRAGASFFPEIYPVTSQPPMVLLIFYHLFFKMSISTSRTRNYFRAII